tara:strand:+ start:549 stop:734 length:186 start_codon:yes stop_codon:yes gene_type:complete
MREPSMKSLWAAIKDLFTTIYQALNADQEKMDRLKEEHLKANQVEDEYYPERKDDEDIIGI